MTTILIVLGIFFLWYAERAYIVYRKYGMRGVVLYLNVEYRLTQGDLSFLADKKNETL